MSVILLPTVDDIKRRAEAQLRKPFAVTGPASYTLQQLYDWVKDAYDIITDALLTPRAHDVIQPESGIRRYPVPGDCYDNFNGIIRITYANVPLVKLSLQEAMERFGHGIDYLDPTNTNETWFNPSSVNGVVYWLEEDNMAQFTVIGTPTSRDITNGNVFDVYYVQEQAPPTALTDLVPISFKPMVAHIPTYIVGRALESEKSGRGASLLEEFEARVLKRKSRFNRQGRRTVAEAYTQDMNAYEKIYKGRLGGYFR